MNNTTKSQAIESWFNRKIGNGFFAQVGPEAGTLFAMFIAFADLETMTCQMSAEYITEKTGLSPELAQTAIKRLVEIGVVVIEGESLYRIVCNEAFN